MAGYSATPLIRKLGIRPGHRVLFVNAPDGYDRTLGTLPEDVTVRRAARGTLDFVQLFVTSQAELRRRLPGLKKALDRDGMLWICWPKRTSGLATDLGSDMGREPVRELGLAAGLVDVKVCAVDDDWSGLKFVYRKADRKPRTER